MSEANSFLGDLNDAIARGTAESRTRALWHATDLMLTGRFTAPINRAPAVLQFVSAAGNSTLRYVGFQTLRGVPEIL